MSYSAGELSRQVTFQALSTSKDGFGQVVRTWSNVPGLVAIFAKVNPLGGQELLAAKAIHAESSVEIVVRFRTTVASTMRIVYQGRHYNIVNINDIETRHEWLQLLCTEGVADG